MRGRLALAVTCISIVPSAIAQEADITFKTRVNLVSVPVVVRDSKGVPVGNLEKADFQLFDKGKLQTISRFSVETTLPKTSAAPEKRTEGGPPATNRLIPDRFVAYLFDDVHLQFGELVWMRDAARRNMDGLAASDRAAIYTTSGLTMLDFTDDRDAWRTTLQKLGPHPLTTRSHNDCPDLSFYQANQISNRADSFALRAATNEVMACAHLDPRMRNMAEAMANAAARRVVAENEREIRVSFDVLRDVVKRMGTTPGQRIIVLASPGFMAPEAQRDKTDIIDRAIRAGITINAIDGRGLWVDPTFDASRPGYGPQVMQEKNRYDRDSASLQADVLAELAAGTGGTFFQNSNDVDAGFKRAAAAPEYSYILGFSPEDLKMDGSYHSLKVSLVKSKGLSALARKGYYAPKTFRDPAAAAKEEIWEAVFSRQEKNELPVGLTRQLTRQGNKTTLTIYIGVKDLRFRKEKGLNHNSLTVTLGIFDRNGNLVRSLQKMLNIEAKDETLAQYAATGVSLNLDFEIAPGSYLARMVARDSESEQMSAQNGTLELR